MRILGSVAPRPDEVAAAMPGDDLVPGPDSVMDRAFSLDAPPDVVWPWLVQLGKRRAGWYLPRSVERLVPPSRRAVRYVDPRWQRLAPGDLVPDYGFEDWRGGRDATFEAVTVSAPDTLVYRSQRGSVHLSWAFALEGEGTGTRVRLRLRLGPLRRPWLADSVGDAFDLVTIAGMAAGLRERLAQQAGTAQR